MYAKTDVTNKLAELKAYSIAEEPLTESLFSPIESAVQAYFNAVAGTAGSFRDVIKYMYNDIFRRTTVYENEFPLNLPTNYPAGYSDLRACFYDFATLMEIDNETFYNGFIFESQSTGTGGTGGSTVIVPVRNTYLDTWTTAITNATTLNPASVAAMAEWCKNSEGDCDLVDLLEDRGIILEQKSREEITQIIYIERGLLEVVQTLGISVYIPTLLQNQ